MIKFCVLLLIAVVTIVSAATAPVIKLYEVDENNVVLREYNKVDTEHAEAFVPSESIQYLRLECQAPYPVQWIYTGNGVPLSSSLISSERLDNNEKKYTAALFLNSLKESHTGNYQCSRTKLLTQTPNVYLYVPGKKLFTSTKARTIRVKKDKSIVLIPCSITDPKVQVRLEKLQKDETGETFKPVSTSSDVSYFQPRRGFTVNLENIREPEGVYRCEGTYGDATSEVMYNVVFERSEVEEVEDYPNDQPNQKVEACKGDGCLQPCGTHTDCPDNMSCRLSHEGGPVCDDPCIRRCGENSMCRTTNHLHKCYCPFGFEGNANEKCVQI